MISIDKKGCSFETRSYEPQDYSCLLDMYMSFIPKGAYQGLPPRKEEAIVAWIEGLLRIGENILAWRGDKVMGHVVILPDLQKDAGECLIFVGQQDRQLGVGKRLTIEAIEKARDLGLARIWLTVDAYNFSATRLYKSVGFEYCDECDYSSERVMSLTL